MLLRRLTHFLHPRVDDLVVLDLKRFTLLHGSLPLALGRIALFLQLGLALRSGSLATVWDEQSPFPHEV
jgi:hypothetical protein